MLASVYGFQAVYANVIGVFTNTVPVDAYRGAGRPESNYLVERLIDAAARELRHRPHRAAPAQHGAALARCRTARAMGQTYDSGDFQRVLDAGAAEDGLGRLRGAPRGERAAAAASAASAWPTTSRRPAAADSERAEIRFADDGFVDVYVGTQIAPARGTRPPMCS